MYVRCRVFIGLLCFCGVSGQSREVSCQLRTWHRSTGLISPSPVPPGVRASVRIHHPGQLGEESIPGQTDTPPPKPFCIVNEWGERGQEAHQPTSPAGPGTPICTENHVLFTHCLPELHSALFQPRICFKSLLWEQTIKASIIPGAGRSCASTGADSPGRGAGQKGERHPRIRPQSSAGSQRGRRGRHRVKGHRGKGLGEWGWGRKGRR